MNLFVKNSTCSLILEAGAKQAIVLAARDLQRNLRDLSGQKDGFDIVDSIPDRTGIYIYTKQCDAAESYEILVDHEKVVITGADTLGTVYGIYAFATQCLHIMPTYRLTDVFPKQTEQLEIEPQIIRSKEREVRFRGWFLNDEDLLSEFKISGGKREIDYPFYQDVVDVEILDMILETALRLENNLIIPASFLNIDNPDETVLADAVYKRGLYISQHHVEPMGVSYFSAEDYVKKHGYEGEKVSFISNRKRFEEIWRYYAEKWAVYGDQVIWQLGLRGKGDQAVWQADPTAPVSMEDRGQIITDAIQTQYDIICDVLGHQDFYSTATLWNEGSGLYGKGHLKLPRNTIAIFSDLGMDQMLGEDLFSTACKDNEMYGIYYHVAFWLLGPHLTEGCNPEKMAYNYRNAKEQGKLFYSILNVSNVRPLHYAVTMNAKILENPSCVSVQDESLKFEQEIFGDKAEKVQELSNKYYACFADFTKEAVICKTDEYHFYYRDYKNLPFMRNPATDGQVSWYGRKLLSGQIHTDRPNAKGDIPELKKSALKFQALYEEMVKFEKELDQETAAYFSRFLKYQTRHMQLITEWAVTCDALVDEALPWNVRKEQGEYGCVCLAQLLEERKVLEEGKWANWHRGDKKINLALCYDRTREYIDSRENLK